MDQTSTNIVIIGQGAIGLLWYHHLSQVNNPLHVSLRVNLLASNQGQLSLAQQSNAQYQFTPYQQASAQSYPLSYAQADDIKQADIILLCIKSFQVANALAKISTDISPSCMVILAHNGMGTLDQVRTILSDKQAIFAMLTTHGCLRNAPLTITHTGKGHSDIGIISGKVTLQRQIKLTNLLQYALSEVCFHQDITEKQWLKLAINCVINPITAINNIENGEVIQDKYAKQITLLLTEVKAVSEKVGINLNIKELTQTVRKVAKGTARNSSSMRCDVLAKKPTEIDYINGYIHRLGEKYHVATPENSRLWQRVRNLLHESI
jgi:2-dehydropantoate 2-reductase